MRGTNKSDTPSTVSYTHLDVYKRQAQTWAADTLNAFYNSFALEILQSKFQFRLGVAFNFKIFNKTFFLQPVSYTHLHRAGQELVQFYTWYRSRERQT